MLSDSMRNLTLPTISAAVGVEERTARVWTNTNGLYLGDRAERERGHPRYDLTDAVRLLMVDQLIERFGMRASLAVKLTNEAASRIALLAADELAQIDDPSAERVGEHYLLCFLRVSDPISIEFLTPAEIAFAWGSLNMQGIIDLLSLTRQARDLLAGALDHLPAGSPWLGTPWQQNEVSVA